MLSLRELSHTGCVSNGEHRNLSLRRTLPGGARGPGGYDRTGSSGSSPSAPGLTLEPAGPAPFGAGEGRFGAQLSSIP